MASSGGREAQVAVTVTPGEPVVAQPTAEETNRSIEALLTAFARAVESRDITQLRRAYPGMTPEEEEVYRGTLPTVQRLVLSLDRPFDVRETAAFATGTAQFFGSHRLEETVSFRATLDFTSGTWQLTSISFGQQ